MGNGNVRIKSNLFPIPHAPCPMTAGAPLGETPRPHCLPHAHCPMPIALKGKELK
ncbi:hypothetical protein [Tolypothrix sp. VBCCA 56010]|uniref:hypothetical protein n=1 Tax=Tolypothrix sp. VBCCA 56010 TaxID=3137731 RepID=UPI003D7D3232